MRLKGIFEEKPVGVKLAVLLLFLLAGAFGGIYIVQAFGLGSTHIKLTQAITVTSTLLLPALLAAWFCSTDPLNEFYIKQPIPKKQPSLIICATLAVAPCINLIHYYNKMMSFPSWLGGVERWMIEMESATEQATKLLLQTESIGELLIILSIVALLAAVSEELLFRGVLFRWIKSTHIGSHWTIWIIAFVFSAIHLQFFGFVPRLLLGAYLGYLLLWTGSLRAPILAHFTHNALGVLLYYRYAGTEEEFMMEPGTGSTLWFSAIGAVIFLFCLRKIWEQRIQRAS